MKVFLVFTIGFLFLIVSANAHESFSLQTTRDVKSSLRNPCELSLEPIFAQLCGFQANLDEVGNLKLAVVSPNSMNLSGQFETDFPDRFWVTIPFSMIAHEAGIPLLSNFKGMKVDSARMEPCGRWIQTELSYDHFSHRMTWSYTTFSRCSHDDYRASMEIDLEEDLSVKSIQYLGKKSTLAMCPGGYSHGYEHRFVCHFKK